VPLNLQLAAPADAVAVAALRNAVAENLTARFGKGHWSGCCTERGVLWDMRIGKIYVALKLPFKSAKDCDIFVVSFPKADGHYGFPNNFIEKEAAASATTRNWNTLCKMIQTVSDKLVA
jgi:hypothetical protein